MSYRKYVLRAWLRRRVEKTAMWIAWHMPRELRKWVVVRAFAAAWAKPPYKTPDEIGYHDVMKEVMP